MISTPLIQQLPVDIVQLFLVWLAILCASILRSFTGFGFALAAMPIFSLFLTPAHSILLCASLSLFIGISTFPSYWKKEEFSSVFPLFLLSLVATPIGASLLAGFPPKYFKLTIGLAVIVSTALLCVCRPTFQHLGRRRKVIRLSLAGFLSGILNGAFAIPGPPIIIYTMATVQDPHRSRSAMIMFFTLSSALVLVTYGINGYLDSQTFFLFLFSFPVMIIGDRAGYRLLNHFGTSLYRRISLTTLLCIGLATMLQAMHEII